MWNERGLLLKSWLIIKASCVGINYREKLSGLPPASVLIQINDLLRLLSRCTGLIILRDRLTNLEVLHLNPML